MKKTINGASQHKFNRIHLPASILKLQQVNRLHIIYSCASFKSATASSVSRLLAFFFEERNEYNAGTTYKVSTSANSIPPTITIPSGTRLLPAEPNANAIGNAPNVVASVVIRIGRNRATDASTAAGIFFSPLLLFCLAHS